MADSGDPDSSKDFTGEIYDRDDILAQLAQKEEDLRLAAQLGKALLESNQELQSRYDQMCEELTHKVEVRLVCFL